MKVLVAVSLLFIAAALTFALLGIWTGDGRWGLTAIVAGVVGFFGVLVWSILMDGRENY